MINKYKNAEKELKDYRASKIHKGTTKNGKAYTNFTIADAKQVNGQWVYEDYTVWSYQEGLDVQENDRVQLLDIVAVEANESEYNGKKFVKRTIFADVKVIPSGNRVPAQPEIIANPLADDGGLLADQLPF